MLHGPQVAAKLRNVSGVSAVKTIDQADGHVRLRVESEMQKDVRRELAQAVVQSGWGLLELHASKMSLEDIFLKLTTAETTEAVETPASNPEN